MGNLAKPLASGIPPVYIGVVQGRDPHTSRPQGGFENEDPFFDRHSFYSG